MTTEKKEVHKSPSGRPERKRVGAANRLLPRNLDQDRFYYRWVTDTNDRITSFKDAGYEIVSAKEAGLEKARLEGGEGSDGLISVGGGQKAVLMKLPIEFHKEDNLEKQEAVDNQMDAIENPDFDGRYGSIEIT